MALASSNESPKENISVPRKARIDLPIRVLTAGPAVTMASGVDLKLVKRLSSTSSEASSAAGFSAYAGIARASAAKLNAVIVFFIRN